MVEVAFSKSNFEIPSKHSTRNFNKTLYRKTCKAPNVDSFTILFPNTFKALCLDFKYIFVTSCYYMFQGHKGPLRVYLFIFFFQGTLYAFNENISICSKNRRSHKLWFFIKYFFRRPSKLQIWKSHICLQGENWENLKY